jgi:hypothetical protein
MLGMLEEALSNALVDIHLQAPVSGAMPLMTAAERGFSTGSSAAIAAAGSANVRMVDQNHANVGGRFHLLYLRQKQDDLPTELTLGRVGLRFFYRHRPPDIAAACRRLV